MSRHQFTSLKLSQIDQLITLIDQELIPGSILRLVGEVGSGKTELTKNLMLRRGVDSIASPTFSLHHNYFDRGGQKYIHADLYRLQSEDDLESSGFWDSFQDQKNIVIVEWADLLDQEAWPLGWKQITVEITKGDFERDYLITVES